MGPRRRPTAHQATETSESDFSDACDPQEEHHNVPSKERSPSGHSKGENKEGKLIKRLVFGTLLLFMLCGIIAAGHLWTMLFVILIQWTMFRELVNVRYHQRRFKDIPLFRTSQWGWFYACVLLSYGQALSKPGASQLIRSKLLLSCLPYVEFISFVLYSILLVGTVLTLRPGKYKYQMGQLAWTISIVVITVVQVHCFSANILRGLFWFLFPVSLVICNDSMAYFCGMGFGRKFIKRPFLGDLSPNKTWEGFIGGGICTVVFAFASAPLYPTFTVCPCEELNLMGGFIVRHMCELPSSFIAESYELPWWMGGANGSTVALYPIRLHALVLGLFASVVAPFGGFFASGIKRAYNLDDFASIIPGHGGVYDRVDCQLIMGLATHSYYVTFIRGAQLSTARLLQLALTLPDGEKVELYKSLGVALKQEGLSLR